MTKVLNSRPNHESIWYNTLINRGEETNIPYRRISVVVERSSKWKITDPVMDAEISEQKFAQKEDIV